MRVFQYWADTEDEEAMSNQLTECCCIDRLSWHGKPEKFLLVLTLNVAALTPAISLADLFSAVRTAWPVTRSAHSFLEFCAYLLNVLTSGFRFVDGDNPADPLIACQRGDILPFCPRGWVRNENFS